MKENWGVNYQLVPPDIHRQNTAEISIRTFKAHLLARLAGVAHDFPRHVWYLLLPQAELTLNFLRRETSNPSMSAWESSVEPLTMMLLLQDRWEPVV